MPADWHAVCYEAREAATEIARLTAELAEARAEQDALAGALTKAADRLDWAAGIVQFDQRRDEIRKWADEARDALARLAP